MKKLLLLILLLLPACDNNHQDTLNGYIEGEYVYIAPSTGGIIEELFVKKGDDLEMGTKLFAINTDVLQANLDSAKLSLENAYSNYANLTKGKRPEEIKIILKQQDQAKAVLTNASQELQRTQKLKEANFASQAELDAKISAYDQAKAHLEELNASLQTAMLGAREDEITIAKKQIEISRQDIVKAQKNYDDNHPKAKTKAKVEDLYYRLGEFVNAGAPVIKILPPENIKARFFVSQKLLPKFSLGKTVYINCDGCIAPVKATVTFISSQAEFTPPVIYSVESRDKLVFMIEAAPDEFTPSLHPGLPINITMEQK